MELVRSGAADGAGVRGNRPELEPEAGEDARIGVVHIAVFALEVGVVGVERIAVLHDEFPPAHDAEAGPALVAELGLDLVEVRRQPPVALQLAPRKIGNDLLRRGLHDEIALVPILEAQELRPVRLPAARLLPELTGLHDGHDELEGAGAIHLLAHDPLHLAHDAQAERQPRIDARRQAPDEAGAQHQPMADDLRLGGHFFLCRDKKLRGFHGPAPALSLPEACGKIERRILLRYGCRPMLDKEGYRPNVGIILANCRNEVFWGKRVNQHAWQFPQGGIKHGETPLEAMFRELEEEIGLQRAHVRILGRTREWLRYEVPE